MLDTLDVTGTQLIKTNFDGSVHLCLSAVFWDYFGYSLAAATIHSCLSEIFSMNIVKQQSFDVTVSE